MNDHNKILENTIPYTYIGSNEYFNKYCWNEYVECTN